MNQIKQRPRGAFFIIIPFLVLLAAQVVLYGNFFRSLNADTQVINELSRIRGSIQRYTKLELSPTRVKAIPVKNEIDRLIARNKELPLTKKLTGESRYYDLESLNIKWSELKSLIEIYHDDPSQNHMLSVISKSEECWIVADSYVVRQQYIVNQTATYYKYFTMTFGINLFVIVLILALYKRFVLNSIASSAINDSLTQIFNKGYFDQFLEHEIARAARKRTAFSLIMLDIDHFKHVNDTYGHRQGDYALKALADVVRKCKRNADVLARFGGEEFIVLLPDTALSEAVLLAERIRESVEAFPFEEIGRMAISLGVTEFSQDDNKESILTRVDSALYLAKENGRNRCEVIRKGEKNA